MHHIKTLRPSAEHIFYHEPRGEPYRQARQLLAFGILHRNWLWINGLKHETEAWALAHSLDEMIRRGFHGGSAWMREYRPNGTRILTEKRIILYADYFKNIPQCLEITISYVRAGKDVVQQVRSILASGIANNKCLVIHGDPEYASALAYLLDRAIQEGNHHNTDSVGFKPTCVCVQGLNQFRVIADYVSNVTT